MGFCKCTRVQTQCTLYTWCYCSRANFFIWSCHSFLDIQRNREINQCWKKYTVYICLRVAENLAGQSLEFCNPLEMRWVCRWQSERLNAENDKLNWPLESTTWEQHFCTSVQTLTIVCWQANIWHSNFPKAPFVNILVLAYFTLVVLDFCRQNSANWLNCWLITIPRPLAASWALGKDATRI